MTIMKNKFNGINKGAFSMSHVYITEDGAKISKRGGHFILSRNSEVLFEIPEEGL